MDVLWDAEEPQLVRDVVTQLQPERHLAYTTVMTVLDNVHRKRWLTRERDGPPSRYWPPPRRPGAGAAVMSPVPATRTDRAAALARRLEQRDPDAHGGQA